MERRLLHAQKLESIGVLAGGIAHDFNNILAGIMGYADLARLRLPESEPAREDIEVIKKAAQRAADLTRQMLAYSGKGKFIVEPVDLSRVVEDSKKMLAMSVSKKARVTYNLTDNLPVIQADAAQMCQVVMNLVINASEALDEHGGAIAVSTNAIRCQAKDLAGMGLGEGLPEGEYVCLEVADTGCGMDEQTLAKIFDPFFTTKFTGRGLGLSGVHGIVRGHKGAIQVSSEPGKGTTFRVLFPASGPAIPAMQNEPAATPVRSSGTVLIVDDDETIRISVQRMIERSGFSVLTASGGQEAIRLFREHQQEVNCVLLDLTMPDLDGAETFRELRKIRPDVRVLLSSGFSEEAATERFPGQGLAGFVQKPYQLDTLITKLQEVQRGG
jgi:CheY-like chemotaxis protein